MAPIAVMTGPAAVLRGALEGVREPVNCLRGSIPAAIRHWAHIVLRGPSPHSWAHISTEGAITSHMHGLLTKGVWKLVMRLSHKITQVYQFQKNIGQLYMVSPVP